MCVKQLAMPTTSFARKISWCWHITVPQPPLAGQPYPQIIIDAVPTTSSSHDKDLS